MEEWYRQQEFFSQKKLDAVHEWTKGDKIVFTSTRSGDLELYTMNIDGSDVKQITTELGYDGGAWFSPDGKKVVIDSPHEGNGRQMYLIDIGNLI